MSHQQQPGLSEAHNNSQQTKEVLLKQKHAREERRKSDLLHCALSVVKLQQEEIEKLGKLTTQPSTEHADLKAQQSAQAQEWESALARHDSDSKLFKYTVRGCDGPHLSGIVPLSIFEAEPNSALACMYNGEWEYAMDGKGRAIVNSDPDHWPIILNWLSFGAIPSTPSDSLLAECRYWQLNRLLAAIEHKADGMGDDDAGMVQASKDSHHLRVKGTTSGCCKGFSVTGMIHHLPKRLSAAIDPANEISIPFTAVGRDWSLTLCQTGSCLLMLSGLQLTMVQLKMEWGSGANAIVMECRREKVLHSESSWGWPCEAGEVERMMHPSMLSIQGSLQLTTTATFKL